jgi:aspartate aminotransferase
LRRAIARKLREQNKIDADEQSVLIVNGGMQGLFGAFQSTVNPGDDVLIFSPYWTPIKDLVAHCGGRLVLVPTSEARPEGIRATLARYATDATRVALFQHPDESFRRRVHARGSEEVASFAIERDLIVIADEAMKTWSTMANTSRSLPCRECSNAPSLRSPLSKSYAMTGWRIGYAVATEPWMTGLAKCTLYSSNGVSTPTQWAALAAFTTSSDFLETSRAGLSRTSRSSRRRFE